MSELDHLSQNRADWALGKEPTDRLPIVHLIFSNLKAWLNGVRHGVSADRRSTRSVRCSV